MKPVGTLDIDETFICVNFIFLKIGPKLRYILIKQVIILFLKSTLEVISYVIKERNDFLAAFLSRI